MDRDKAPREEREEEKKKKAPTMVLIWWLWPTSRCHYPQPRGCPRCPAVLHPPWVHFQRLREKRRYSPSCGETFSFVFNGESAGARSTSLPWSWDVHGSSPPLQPHTHGWGGVGGGLIPR